MGRRAMKDPSLSLSGRRPLHALCLGVDSSSDSDGRNPPMSRSDGDTQFALASSVKYPFVNPGSVNRGNSLPPRSPPQPIARVINSNLKLNLRNVPVPSPKPRRMQLTSTCPIALAWTSKPHPADGDT